MTASATTGLLSSTRNMALLFDAAAAAFHSKETVLDSFTAITQVGSWEGSTVCFRWTAR